jgi:uncharacterized membrane protein (UPF0127 family)
VAWLVRDGEVLATLEIASTFAERTRGLLGRDGFDGALLIERTRSVHTLGMRFPIDVAYLDSTMTVLDVVPMRRWRAGRPRPRARCVLEAEAGAFERWRLRPGDHLEIKG